jgi:hypothetical protein
VRPKPSFIAFDTEDDSAELLAAGKSGFEKRVTQIAAMTADGEKFYTTSEHGAGKFLTWLDGRSEKTIYAHNLQYDLGNLFPRDLHKFNLLFVGGRLVRAYGFGKLWLDSFNIWPMSLKKLAPAFGLEKLKFDSESKEYVFRDVEIVRAAMIFAHKFAQQLHVDKLPGTLGGFCVKAFHAGGGRNCEDVDRLSRLGYYGGRVELFSSGGRGRVYYTDINSLYPSAMTLEFPVNAQPQKTPRGFGVIDATVYVPECDIAPLPYRREDGAILFPCGTFRGVWTYQELENAVDYGAKIKKIHTCYGSTRGRKFYAGFIEKIYGARLKADSPAEKLMLKLLMNNLYGRLGISGSVTRNRRGTLELYDCEFPLPEFTNYLHAAYVTSYGRLQLQNYLRRVPARDLIYCDTDSIMFFHNSDKPPFECGKKLGQMKLEGIASRCYTYAPKVYIFGHHAKAKGVRRDAAVEFIRNGKATVQMPFRVRECCDFLENATGEKKIPSVWRCVEKNKRTAYTKKRFDNGRYFPLFIARS